MLNPFPSLSLNTLKTYFRGKSKFEGDESGVAAMEFAIIAPLIIGLYLGLAELASALSVERRISHSASVGGDLTTQVSTIRAADAEDIVSAVLHVANLDRGDEYAINIQTFERLSDGSVESGGIIQYQSGTVSSFLYDPDEFDNNILPVGSGMVAATVRFRHVPFGFTNTSTQRSILPNFIDMEDVFLLKPRQSNVLQFGPDQNWTTINCTGRVTNVSCTETAGSST